jgi:hypothetical protein
MTGLFWRVLTAAVAVVFAYALIPPVSRLLNVPLRGDLLTVVQGCIAGIAVFYILQGRRR